MIPSLTKANGGGGRVIIGVKPDGQLLGQQVSEQCAGRRSISSLFCQRHFPLPGRIEPGSLQRVDRPLIPPDAMREILVNALIHRDYTIVGGAVSLAIFDDRVEVWSAGRFPTGITPESLKHAHPSVQRNPIIAEGRAPRPSHHCAHPLRRRARAGSRCSLAGRG